jgi:hypothetical protein
VHRETASILESMLKVAVSREHGIELVAVCGRHLVLETPHLDLHRVQIREDLERGLANSPRTFGVDLLLQQSDAQSAHLFDSAFVWILDSEQQLEGRRLAGTIASDQSDVLARIDLK